MKRTFRQFGIPEAIRSDNGPPFATKGVAALSELRIWWARLGIRHERIEPGKPQQNGRHERMHLTLKQEACMPPSQTPSAQKQAFHRFVREFNFERPHEALAMRTPNELYVKSEKLYSRQFAAEARFVPNFDRSHVLVSPSGKVEWKGRKIFIGKVLQNQCLEVTRVGEQQWVFQYGPHSLGVIDETKSPWKLGKVSPMS